MGFEKEKDNFPVTLTMVKILYIYIYKKKI